MLIEFEHLKSEIYETGEDELYGFYFRSNQKIPAITDKQVLIYREDQELSEEKIYMQLANIDCVEKAQIFCSKYGALTPSNSVMFEVYKYIENKNYSTIRKRSIYDYILFNHLRYYQITANCLINIKSLISQKKHQDNHLSMLFFYCIVLLSNPHFFDLFELEYNGAIEPEHQLELFNDYPIFKFQYVLSFNSECCKLENDLDFSSISNKIYQHPDTIPTLIKHLHKFPEKAYIDFLDTILHKYGNDLKSKDCQLYLKKHKKDLMEFATYLFTESLSFEIRNTTPIVTRDSFDNFSTWKFKSLSTAIFYFFYVDSCNGNIYKQCQNENCKRLFICPISRKNKIYCSHTCAHNVANRKYKNSKKRNQ